MNDTYGSTAFPLIPGGRKHAAVDIAAKLNLSVSTVQHHVKNMRHKAHIKPKTEVVTHAFAAGALLPTPFLPRWSGAPCLYVALGD
ncbi:MAG TPA: hypothetical protein VF482_13225 [Trebonia sp.]